MSSGRFWVEDEFIDNYAKKLSHKAQLVYFCLKRHANKDYIVCIGKRKISEKIKMNISTVRLALQELEGGGFITQWDYKVGGNSIPIGTKELIKGTLFKKTNDNDVSTKRNKYGIDGFEQTNY